MKRRLANLSKNTVFTALYELTVSIITVQGIQWGVIPPMLQGYRMLPNYDHQPLFWTVLEEPLSTNPGSVHKSFFWQGVKTNTVGAVGSDHAEGSSGWTTLRFWVGPCGEQLGRLIATRADEFIRK